MQEPKLTGIIGYPLGHSISPVFQQAAFAHAGLNIRYERWPTPPEDLAPRILGLHRPAVLGANVTVPHKERVLPLLDEVGGMAKRIGAVNTIVNKGGRLIGHNTDAPGFLRALTEDGGFQPKGKSVLVLGAGGGARAVVFALLQAGVASIELRNRTAERADDLARSVVGEARGARVTSAPWRSGAPAADLIVNTTTMGMLNSPAASESPLAATSISRTALVCDLVYNPVETPLLREARKAGARLLGGLPMLVYQGAEAFELWTGQKPPVEVMMEAARRAL